MMKTIDGHWWNKKCTVGWCVKKKKHGWKGYIIIDGIPKCIAKTATRVVALKRAVKKLSQKINPITNQII